MGRFCPPRPLLVRDRHHRFLDHRACRDRVARSARRYHNDREHAHAVAGRPCAVLRGARRNFHGRALRIPVGAVFRRLGEAHPRAARVRRDADHRDGLVDSAARAVRRARHRVFLFGDRSPATAVAESATAGARKTRAIRQHRPRHRRRLLRAHHLDARRDPVWRVPVVLRIDCTVDHPDRDQDGGRSRHAPGVRLAAMPTKLFGRSCATIRTSVRAAAACPDRPSWRCAAAWGSAARGRPR